MVDPEILTTEILGNDDNVISGKSDWFLGEKQRNLKRIDDYVGERGREKRVKNIAMECLD